MGQDEPEELAHTGTWTSRVMQEVLLIWVKSWSSYLKKICTLSYGPACHALIQDGVWVGLVQEAGEGGLAIHWSTNSTGLL